MWYSLDKEELIRQLETKRNGLTQQEAARRLEKHGYNRLTHKKRKPLLLRILGAFGDKMTLVLLAAAGVSFGADLMSGQTSVDPFVILAIVFLNAIISLVQESRAEKALEALKKLSAPTCTLLRDGKECTVSGEEVVPGDVVLLQKGMVIPCDGRLLEAVELLTDESPLTGESGGISKDASRVFPRDTQIGDLANSVWGGTAVMGGKGSFVAVHTGMDTAMGSIAAMLDQKEEQTPLQKKLAGLSALFGNLTLVICGLIFLLSLWKGMAPGEMFLTGVSLAVAAIPEGLPAIVTIVLSLGVQRMAKKRAIVRKLPAVETLGCAGVICSDKTGTLTCNRMTVTDVYGERDKLARDCYLCNDRASPTEEALYSFAESTGRQAERLPRVGEIPFSSENKYMATLHKGNGEYLTILKGAPDVLAGFCGGIPREMEIAMERMAGEAKRVIGFAEAVSTVKPGNLLKQHFRFVGLCGLEDPPRAGVTEAVKQCKEAGILPVMITGDHASTACAVAKKIGILGDGNVCYTQKELEQMSPEQFTQAVRTCTVYARTTPAFKMQIVDAYRKNGYVVAMTGDGVNDAPALKKADVGCAMGKGGTEVAREASDLILTDDNFATVVDAVQEGRTVFRNIRSAVHYLLSCNIGEIVTVFLGILMSLPSPLMPIQLLWVNLATDSLPAISLGLEKADASVMKRPPAKGDQPLFPPLRWLEIFAEGILIGCLTLIAFGMGSMEGGFAVGRTMAFSVLAISQLVHAVNMRSRNSVLRISPFSNPYLTGSILLVTGVQVALVQLPALGVLFGTVPLSMHHWTWVAGLSLVPLVFCECYKWLKKKFR